MDTFEWHILPFFEDDRFIKWVVNPDSESIAYWKTWMDKHPDQAEVLLYAREVALQLRASETPADLEKLSGKIWETIQTNIDTPPSISPRFRKSHRRFLYRIAASVSGLLLLAVAALYVHGRRLPQMLSTPEKVTGVVRNNILERTNKTIRDQVVYLVDGTRVTLQPGSTIKHTVFLEKNKREVFLDGNAFFEVAGDSRRPFYVYAHDIVLKVLGTSFNVTTDSRSGNITVIVKTGKVSVSKNSNGSSGELVLTPNERILYSAQTQKMVKSGLDSAHIPVIPGRKLINFNFDDMPVSDIFATLEEGYGIRINYDRNFFSKFRVTTSLTDESFEDKLKVICAAINAGYRIGDNEVYIEGR